MFGIPKGKGADSILRATKRLNIWEGAVRSSKSVNAMIAFAYWVKNDAPQGDIIITGKTRDTIKRNVLYPMLELVGKKNLSFSLINGEGKLYKRRFHIIGGVDEHSEFRLRGITAAGALVDEGTILPESFFKMLLTRLSVDGARLYLTTNPDAPAHWLKTGYIDNEEVDDKVVFHFNIEDNPYLSKTYIDNMKKEFKGLYYKRFILGLWVQAEGAVYDFFDEDTHCFEDLQDYDKYYVTVDYGTNNPCVFLLCGICGESVDVIKEYYYDGGKHGKLKTDQQYLEDMVEFTEGYQIKEIIVDPSALSFITLLRQSGFPVRPAKNDVIDGIRTVARMMDNGILNIHTGCKNTIREIQSYVWDSKAQLRGIDQPLKKDDHSVDCLRYLCFTLYGKGTAQAIKNPFR